ncbi:unnamed protein product, partial [Symbiodinium microadriaticum]
IHEDHPQNIESLQYLEALCKDLGRPHEEYTAKLDKLRRSQPVMQSKQGGGGVTRAAPAPSESAATAQRSVRPARPERGGGVEADID